MRYVDDYRDADAAGRLMCEIRRMATRRWVLMEVCGGQTHSLLRHGIEPALEGSVELIHGPGCPVCVTPVEAIDFAQRLALEPGVTVASFGDMLRVPGSRQSLQGARTLGASVRIVYSPLDAVALAQREPQTQVVFFAVGFETTAPATALAVAQAERLGLENFSLIAVHVCVEPAMRAILESPDCRVQAFLAAGHVCTVMGYESYRTLAERHHVPIAITGFEPTDLLEGILECVQQLEAGTHDVVNRYARAVANGGNRAAQELVATVYEAADRPWRGLGVIPQGGLALRYRWRRFDATERFGHLLEPAAVDGECLAGDVLTGRIRPTECPHFGTRCTPDTPLGAPMVSSEGACAAYFRYRGGAAAALESSGAVANRLQTGRAT